jgi:hypothetical protein
MNGSEGVVSHHRPGSLPELVPSFVSGVQAMRFGPSEEVGGHRRRAVEGWSLNLHYVLLSLFGFGFLRRAFCPSASTQGTASSRARQSNCPLWPYVPDA